MKSQRKQDPVMPGEDVSLQHRYVDLRNVDFSGLRGSYLSASPFPHLVVDGLFDENTLETIEREFSLVSIANWRTSAHALQRKRGTRDYPDLPPATQDYFDKIYSGRFLNFLSSVTGIDHLIPDPSLHGGGMHDIPNGGKFELHSDFPRHPATGLLSRLVVITYLNRGWRSDFGGALELWSDHPRERCSEILPEFGRTIIMSVGPRNIHGHPSPTVSPDGRRRRSVAAYFYTNPIAPSAIVPTTGYKWRPTANVLDMTALATVKALPRLGSQLARHFFGRQHTG